MLQKSYDYLHTFLLNQNLHELFYTISKACILTDSMPLHHNTTAPLRKLKHISYSLKCDVNLCIMNNYMESASVQKSSVL